ncbi:MAG: hypothetical protein J6C55_01305 [Oscillospiraceae bacterium]|nr:hypothetical protein [Oscillospiraceae bacterium]
MFKKILIIFFVFLSLSSKVVAQDIENIENIENIKNLEDNYDLINNIYYESGLEDIISRYSNKEMFNFDNFNINKNKKLNLFILSMSPQKIINIVFKYIKTEIKKPIKILMNIIGIVLISALIESLKTCFKNDSLNEIFSCICILSIFISVGYQLIEVSKLGAQTIVNMSDFMLSFVPVYAGVMSSCGLSLTGGVYNTFLFFICQFFSQVLSSKLLPVIGIYMSFCLVGAISGSGSQSLNISQAAKEIKNIITGILVFIVTCFVGLITVQGVVASSADTITTKTAKFVIGSAVPIIGSVVSDAYTSVKGCFNFIRSGVGAIVIFFIIISFLPILIKLALYILITKISSGVAEFLEIKQVSEILKSSGYVISLLLAIIISYILLIIISTTVILILGLGIN